MASKSELLTQIASVRSTLDAIDEKEKYYEEVDENLKNANDKLKYAQNKFLGINFVLLVIVGAIVGLLPCSLASFMTGFFPISFLSPILSFGVCSYLKSKYAKKKLPAIEKQCKKTIDTLSQEKTSIAGDIFDAYIQLKAILLTNTKEPNKKEISQTMYSKMALDFIYEAVNRNKVQTFYDGVDHYDEMVANIDKNITEEYAEEIGELKKRIDADKILTLKRAGLFKQCELVLSSAEK